MQKTTFKNLKFKWYTRLNLALILISLSSFITKDISNINEDIVLKNKIQPSNCDNPLQKALGYNAFVRYGTSVKGGDTEGPIAIGGDLTMKGIITIAAHTAGTNFFNNDDQASSLVVNGKINYNSGEGIHLNNGYVKLGNTTGSFVYDRDNNNASSNTRITSGGYFEKPRLQVQRKQSVSSVKQGNLIDFETAFSEFESTALKYSRLTANVSISRDNKISLVNNQLNVLNITGSELKKLPYLTFENTPNTETPLIINVNAPGDFEWNIFNLSGIGDQQGAYILWNFYNSSSITLNGGGTIIGTLFAPGSTVIKNSSGNINGQVIAKKYDHNGGELHHHIFKPCIDTPCDLVVTVEDKEICIGDSVTLTANAEGDFLWSTGETTQSITVTPTETTNYSVTITKDGCTAINTATVTVKEPKVSLGEDIRVCLGETVTLTSTPADTYLWSTGETTQSITVTPTKPVTWYTIEVTIDGCIAKDMIDVFTDSPKLVVEDQMICKGESVTLTAEGKGNFLWSTGETTQSIEVTPTETTTYTVTAERFGCTETKEVIVTVKDPKVSLGEDIRVCLGETVTLTSTPADTYLWSTGETTQSITVTPTKPVTWYTIEVNIDGCIAKDMIDVFTDSPKLVVEDQMICKGESVTLTAEGKGNFLWSTGETTQSIEVTPEETTTYTVTAERFGCTETKEVIVTVKDPKVSLGEDIRVCLGETVTLTSTPADTYLWSTGETTQSITVTPTKPVTWYTIEVTIDGCIAKDMIDVFTDSPKLVVEDQMICKGESVTLTAEGKGNFLWSTGETTQSIEVTPEETTTYTVTAERFGCTETKEVIVTVKDPKVSLGEDIRVCLGETVTLTSTPADTYLWSTGETTQSITVTPTKPVTWYTIEVTIDGCIAKDMIDVFTNSVDIDAGNDQTITLGESATLTAEGNGDFLWSTDETTQSITVTPTETTTYTITSTKYGCVATDTVTVYVEIDPCLSQEYQITATPIPVENVGILTVDISVIKDQTIVYEIYQMNGNRIGPTVNINLNKGCSSFPIDLDRHCNLKPSTYYILNIMGEGWSDTVRFITKP